jgi:hypothetical protein
MTDEETERDKELKGTLTNNSTQTLRAVEIEVTLKDCPPGYSPTDGADQCPIVGQDNPKVYATIPPHQTRAFKWSVIFSGLPSEPNGQRFFSWRIVSASSCPWDGQGKRSRLRCEGKPAE